MNETPQCPNCKYTAGILCGSCPECWQKREAEVEQTIRERHKNPPSEEEIKRLQEIELTAAIIYMNRVKMFGDDALDLYERIKRLSWNITPKPQEKTNAD